MTCDQFEETLNCFLRMNENGNEPFEILGSVASMLYDMRGWCVGGRRQWVWSEEEVEMIDCDGHHSKL